MKLRRSSFHLNSSRGLPNANGAIALHHLWRHSNPTRVIKLLRRHVPPPAAYCDLLADLMDPSKAKDSPGQLKFVKSGNFFRSMQSSFGLVNVGNKVLDAEKAGEKRYLAVERIFKELGVSERYVWKAVEFAETAAKPPEEQTDY
jgi:hypothetical protein